MLFSDRPRTHYEKTLAHEVICQLRFPTILSINNVEPADFQETGLLAAYCFAVAYSGHLPDWSRHLT